VTDLSLPLPPGGRFAILTREPDEELDCWDRLLDRTSSDLRLPIVGEVDGIPDARVLSTVQLTSGGRRELYDAHIAFPTDGDGILDLAPGPVPDHYLVTSEPWNLRYPEEPKPTGDEVPDDDVPPPRALVDGENYGVIHCDPDPEPRLVVNAMQIGIRYLTTVPDVDGVLICTSVEITPEEASHLYRLHDRFVGQHGAQVDHEALMPYYYTYREAADEEEGDV